jgi:hypothetical protein
VDIIFGPSESIGVDQDPEFGTTVRVNENLRAIGAPHYGKMDEGAFFLYDLKSKYQWSIMGKSNESIGARLSLSNECVAIGRKSSIEVYNVLKSTLKGNPVTALAGNDVALVHDEILFIGEDRFRNREGQVRIMVYNAVEELWNHHQTLSGLALPEGRFGWVVATSENGKRLAVSAPNASPYMNRQGFVQVLERDIFGFWNPLGSIIYGTIEGCQLGFSLALSGDGSTVVIGAPGTNDGSVLVYGFNGKGWQQIGSTLVGKDSGIRFGRSVAVSKDGRRIAASSSFFDRSRGHARVFDLIDSDWIEKYVVEGMAVGDRLGWGNFGLSLSSDGHVIAVGAILAKNIDEVSTGAVKVVDLDNLNLLNPDVRSVNPTELSTPILISPSISPSFSPSTYAPISNPFLRNSDLPSELLSPAFSDPKVGFNLIPSAYISPPQSFLVSVITQSPSLSPSTRTKAPTLLELPFQTIFSVNEEPQLYPTDLTSSMTSSNIPHTNLESALPSASKDGHLTAMPTLLVSPNLNAGQTLDSSSLRPTLISFPLPSFALATNPMFAVTFSASTSRPSPIFFPVLLPAHPLDESPAQSTVSSTSGLSLRPTSLPSTSQNPSSIAYRPISTLSSPNQVLAENVVLTTLPPRTQSTSSPISVVTPNPSIAKTFETQLHPTSSMGHSQSYLLWLCFSMFLLLNY